MKKSKSFNFTFNLNAYAAAAICFLNIRETDSQVIYTDIDPDVIYDEALEGGGLDIDANGTIDFIFLNSSFTFYAVSFSSYQTRQDILAGPYISDNAIAGISETFSAPYGGGFTWYFPYALSQNEQIGPDLQWHNYPQQIMAIRTLFSGGAYSLDCDYCFWYNDFTPIVFDHYLGIKFLDDDGETHYGWIRCDVKDEGRTLIIKDYAYESQPEHAILAGDTTHYLSIFENTKNLNANVYSFGNSVFIKLDELVKDLEIHVYDLKGGNVYSHKITNQFTQIKLNDPPGIYIVELISSEGTFSKKICIN